MSSTPNDPLDPATHIPPAELPARLDRLEAAVRARTDLVPEIGIVLGSGLGGLADEVTDVVGIPFADLPGWPAATAPGHVGRLLLGRLDDVPVVMLQGRLHLYEGNDPGLVVQPVLLMARLGARLVVLTNAVGGLDPSYGPGTLMVIADHLNLTGRTPLLGPNADTIGPRFPDLTEIYTGRHRTALHAAAAAEGLTLREGVYVGLVGPAYETPAEVRWLRSLGADAVGMSTVLEAIALRWAGVEVAGVSLVTNAAAGYTGEPLTHEEVLAAGAAAGPGLGRVDPTVHPRPRPLSGSLTAGSDRRRAGGAAPRRPRDPRPGRAPGPCRRSTGAACGRCSRRDGPSRPRSGSPTSGSRVSVASSTVTRPRPSKTTRACSAPGWRCHGSSHPCRQLDLADREGRRPEVPRPDERSATDAEVLPDVGIDGAPDRLGVGLPAAQQRPGLARVRVVDRGDEGERVDRPLVADQVELRRRLVQDVAGGDDRSP